MSEELYTVLLPADKINECVVNLNSYFNAFDFDSASSQITICRNEINPALAKIKSLQIKYPENRDIAAAELDYSIGSQMLDVYSLIVDIAKNEYSDDKTILRLEQISTLTNDSLNKINLLQTIYSNTEYYQISYKNGNLLEQSKKDLSDVKEFIDDELDSYNNDSGGYLIPA